MCKDHQLNAAVSWYLHGFWLNKCWTKRSCYDAKPRQKNINPEKQKCSRLLFCCIFFITVLSIIYHCQRLTVHPYNTTCNIIKVQISPLFSFIPPTAPTHPHHTNHHPLTFHPYKSRVVPRFCTLEAFTKAADNVEDPRSGKGEASNKRCRSSVGPAPGIPPCGLPWNPSWWLVHQPLWKNMRRRQNGFFPFFRGENRPNIRNHHLVKKWRIVRVNL